jgi:dUTP pyrophosphatase
MKVKIKRLHPNAVVPKYSKPGDAGLDLTITSIKENGPRSVTYGFGVAVEIPEGHLGFIVPRSSIRNTEVFLSNSVGVIDSQYRGELQATFNKTHGNDSIKYYVGDRAAQIIILPYPQIEFEESLELSSTERGAGGFGSTGR